MGSRLGPIIANIFMDNFETRHMSELNKLGVKNWFRYVDDTFVVINNKDQAQKIFEFLYNQHQTIKFTMEEQNNNSINFFYVKLKRNVDENTLSTSTYHKPTFIGMLN